MASVINMQDLRYLNLFGKITKISTRFCFSYNESLIFCVPRYKIPQALGKENENLRKISGITKRRIRVIAKPRGIEDAKYFLESIISPATFKGIEINDKEIIIIAGNYQNKATLMGRNKKRLEEMKKIVKSFFGLDYRIA